MGFDDSDLVCIKRRRIGDLQVAGVKEPSGRQAEAFVEACREGKVDDVTKGLGVVDPSFEQNRALSVAVSNGHEKVVEVLLSDPRVCVDDLSPYVFGYACEFGRTGVVKCLLRENVRPDGMDNYGLIMACKNGHRDIVKCLVEDLRVDVCARNNTPIRFACSNGHVGVVKTLLADKRVEPQDALKLAIKHGQHCVVDILLADKRVSPRHVVVQDGNEECTLLGFVAAHGDKNMIERLLGDPRIDPAEHNNIALGLAAFAGNTPVVKALLADPRVNAGDDDDYALVSAASNGFEEIVQMLLEREDVNPKTDSSFALTQAVLGGHGKIVKILLKDGRSDPSVANNRALKIALSEGNVDVLAALLQDERVDPSVCDVQDLGDNPKVVKQVLRQRDVQKKIKLAENAPMRMAWENVVRNSVAAAQKCSLVLPDLDRRFGRDLTMDICSLAFGDDLVATRSPGQNILKRSRAVLS
eukprot:CAMPEP_0203749100 /NCGR_PEP_ID=MMETSP0098-20131031/3783_1 /ASSEMBLY_ACC=CAM_ASM_000208 /TAXON_ID=96639 /ORGANISM=" , Strain NY0313808BC1" /LENGTH=469 /DNA_ID=CAMNT_0050638059 /DNA_START=398 /DNA_END=1803 /DNA_ORIENTATION=+